MWDRLEQIDARYEELSEQLALPEVTSDPKQLQKLAQERASVENVVTRYREYKATSKALEDTQAMLNDGLDEEMAALVKQEIESLQLAVTKLGYSPLIYSVCIAVTLNLKAGK